MTTPDIVAEASAELLVTPADTADRLGIEPGKACHEVLATHTVIGDMKSAATKRLRPYPRVCSYL